MDVIHASSSTMSDVHETSAKLEEHPCCADAGERLCHAHFGTFSLIHKPCYSIGVNWHYTCMLRLIMRWDEKLESLCGTFQMNGKYCQAAIRWYRYVPVGPFQSSVRLA